MKFLNKILPLVALIPSAAFAQAQICPTPPTGDSSQLCANTKWTGSAIQANLPIFNVKAAPYNAACDGATDDTNAINSAAAALRANGSGILYSPPGSWCYHIGTINLTGLNSPLTGVQASYRSIVSIHTLCSVPNGVCWDAIGAKHTLWEGAELITSHVGACPSGGDDAAIGLQIGRPNPNQTASQEDFVSLYVNGCFSQAAFINFASEVTKFFGGIVDNGSMTAGSHNIRIDCDNHFNNLASAFQTIAWASGSFGSCNNIGFYGTTAQKFGGTLKAVSATGSTITFANVPAWVAVGQIAYDQTVNASLGNGAAVTSVTPGANGTVTFSISASSVVANDIISFSSPDPAVWLDGDNGFQWDKNGYISTGSQYGVEIFYEASQPPTDIDISTHIESYPNLVASILVGGTSSSPVIDGYTRNDEFSEGVLGDISPDYANGVTSLSLSRVRVFLRPAPGVATTWKDWGNYLDIATATQATGGSGCTTGSQTFTAVGGTGIAATLTGTVSGGSLNSGAMTVTTVGSYLFAPSSPITLSGGGCSVAPTATITTGTPATVQALTLSYGEETIYGTTSTSYRSIPANIQAVLQLDGNNTPVGIGRVIGPSWNVPNLPNGSGTILCRSGNAWIACSGTGTNGLATANRLQAVTAYNGSGGSAIPTCNAGAAGSFATVSDGKASPTAGSAYAAADGAATQAVWCNGSGWVYLM